MSPDRLLVLKFTRNYFAGNFFLLRFAFVLIWWNHYSKDIIDYPFESRYHHIEIKRIF